MKENCRKRYLVVEFSLTGSESLPYVYKKCATVSEAKTLIEGRGASGKYLKIVFDGELGEIE